MKNNIKSRYLMGFTMIELLLVIAVIAVMAGFIYTSFPAARKRAADTKRKSDIKEYANVLANYSIKNNGNFPISTISVDITTLCATIGTSECPDDADPLKSYRYQSDIFGTRFAVWTELETATEIWGSCSNGLNGTFSNYPVDGSCPLTTMPTPTPLPPPPTPAVPTPTSAAVPTATPTTAVVPTNTPPPPTPTSVTSPIIKHEETVVGGSVSSTTVYTGSGVSAVPNELYLASISTKPYITVNSVSGLGLSWSLLRRQCAGRSQTNTEVWRGQGVPTGSGVVIAQLSSGSIKSAVIAVSRYSGATSTGNISSANTNGVSGGCSSGVDNTSYSFNLTTTVPDAFIYSAVSLRMRSHTPGSGYTERAEVHAGSSGDASGVAIQDKKISTPSNNVVNGTFSSTLDWAAVAVEIK